MNIWEQVKSKLDIVEVIGEYLPLKLSGANYRALSPFKKEKTPSFMVSPTKQIWHDFSTGKGGDIFGFVAEMENISRLEALRKLAPKAGIKLEKREETEAEKKQKDIYQQGLEILEWSSELYHSILRKILVDRNHPVTQYCIERGLTQAIIDQFGLGYAPKRSILEESLRANSKHIELLEQVGLVVRKQGKLKDKFLDRLMIPVHTMEGKVVGFTGRVLPYDTLDRPKYLNSPQSQWFTKNQLWYGWHIARRTITQEGKAIVVEGNMDVIKAHLSGFGNTIASQGTSFTTSQMKHLSRTTRVALLAFDNDSAGIEAGKKFFTEATRSGIEVQQVHIPSQYKDLDEYLSKEQPKTLLSDYYLDAWIEKNQDKLRSNDIPTQKSTIQELCTLVASLDQLGREQYAARLNTLTGISKTTLLRIIHSAGSPREYTRDDEVSHIHMIELTKEKNQSQEAITIVWQKICALYISVEEIQNTTTTMLEEAFQLIRSILDTEAATFSQYIEQHKDHLHFITEHEVPNSQEFKTLIASLQSMVDRYATQAVFDNEFTEHYLTFKSLAAKV